MGVHAELISKQHIQLRVYHQAQGSMHLMHIIFTAAALFALADAHPANSIGSDQDEDDLEDRSTPGKCSEVHPTACAVLYDDENCEGWSFAVPIGTTDLPEEYQNDAEVVVVKSGCKLIGYDLASHISSLGGSSFCDATNSSGDRYCDILEGFLRD